MGLRAWRGMGAAGASRLVCVVDRGAGQLGRGVWMMMRAVGRARRRAGARAARLRAVYWRGLGSARTGSGGQGRGGSMPERQALNSSSSAAKSSRNCSQSRIRPGKRTRLRQGMSMVPFRPEGGCVNVFMQIYIMTFSVVRKGKMRV